MVPPVQVAELVPHLRVQPDQVDEVQRRQVRSLFLHRLQLLRPQRVYQFQVLQLKSHESQYLQNRRVVDARVVHRLVQVDDAHLLRQRVLDVYDVLLRHHALRLRNRVLLLDRRVQQDFAFLNHPTVADCHLQVLQLLQLVVLPHRDPRHQAARLRSRQPLRRRVSLVIY